MNKRLFSNLFSGDQAERSARMAHLTAESVEVEQTVGFFPVSNEHAQKCMLG